MLKHAHVSSTSLSPYRCKVPMLRPDTVSLTSTMSYGSSGGHEPLSSRSSSTSSIHDAGIPPQKYIFTSSSPHIGGKGDRVVVQTMVKVYARVLCADMEYKTLSIAPHTTSKEVVKLLLKKFRMKHRDSNLFYLTMEVWIRKTGVPIRTLLVLDDEARPAELQACHPRGESKFSLQMRKGGLVKVYDSCLMPGSLYKSLLVSERTTVEELIELLLRCSNMKDWVTRYSVYEVCLTKKYERRLHPRDHPLSIKYDWPNPENFAFQLRQNDDKRRLPWIKSLDLSGQLNFRLCVRDEVCPRAIHSPTLKPACNNYENYFYI